MLEKKSVTFSISGSQYTVKADDVGPEMTLNTFLREKAHLTGTKRMCLEGGCGSCTVAIEETVDGKKHFFSVNSCLVSIFSCHGWEIHTIEGIGNPLIGYHQIQKLLSDNYGTQCGFCSSGMVMNMYALQQSGPKTQKEIENSFGGNICRCTGYRPILYAFKKLASDATVEEIPDIEELKLCPKQPDKICTKLCKTGESLNFFLDFGDSKWMRVHTLHDLLEVLKINTEQNYMLVSGNTARGVYKNEPIPNIYIEIRDVAELISYSVTENRLLLGGNITLSNFIKICNDISTKYKTFSFLTTIAKHLDLVATVQIRNVGSIAGNLMIKHKHKEFPSDIFLLLETFNAVLLIVDVDGNESFSTPQDFLNIDMTKRVIKTIIINALDDSYKWNTYKIMPKSQNAHAIVNAGFLIQIKNDLVNNARIVYGGINPNFIHATNAEKILIGKKLYDNSTIQNVCTSLNDELHPDFVLPDASPEYRKNLAISLFYKFVLSTCPPELISDRYKSGGALLDRPVSKGSQEFGTNKQEWPLTQPIPKLESLAQTSGQAKYMMDLPSPPDEVYVSFVTAKAVAGSSVNAVDTSDALKLEGVIAYYDKKDIPGINNFTPSSKTIFYVDEELFCSGIVKYYDQPIGIIVAKKQDIAWKASELVKIQYGSPTFKAYLNVKEVIRDNVKSRITNMTSVVPKTKGKDIKKIVKGEFFIGLQYHYHMEVQGCKVVPIEGSFEIYPLTQWMDATQLGVANVLGIPESKIQIKVRRLGGAFGAKITRNGMVAAAAALAASKLQVPVRMELSFEQNMNIIGKRFPLYTKYEVGVNDKGLIQYLNANLYSDYGVGGNDAFYPLLVSAIENCYDISTWDFSVNAVKTDTHANAYCRAPGTAEGTCIIESIMEEIAYNLNLPPQDVRSANLNPAITEIPKYLTDLESWANINNRRQQVVDFNKANRWIKRGISVVPMKWVLEVMGTYTVLVSIFHGDGSVSISHGGIEIGQGINTKAAQVCAYKFGIPLNQVTIEPCYSIISPNCMATAISQTSESICYGIIKACDVLLEKMKPIREKMKNPTWLELVKKCFESNIQLNSTGFFSTAEPDIQMYPVFAVCAVDVEVDILTGQHQILQLDIIEDLGKSMSPIVDIGQIEGAFVMGIGYYTSEELIYDTNGKLGGIKLAWKQASLCAPGKLYTNRTWNYKPPGAKDIPINFRIKFAENSFNPVGVLKSKAVGEPPLCLSVAVPLAIRNAVASARLESDVTNAKWVPFDGPTTVEKTFLYSLNKYNQYVLK